MKEVGGCARMFRSGSSNTREVSGIMDRRRERAAPPSNNRHEGEERKGKVGMSAGEVEREHISLM